MDELDLLIDAALGAEADETDAAQVDDQVSDTDEATSESQTEEAPDGQELPSDSDVELSEGQSDQTPETDGTSEDDTDYKTLYSEVNLKAERQAQLLQNILDQAKKRTEDEQNAKREAERDAQFKALQERWEKMDPEDVAKEQLAAVTRVSGERIQHLEARLGELQTALDEKEELSAKAEVVTMLTKQFDLKPDEVDIIRRLNDPQAMEEVGLALQTKRRQQTQAAREAKKEQVSTNEALKSGLTGGSTVTPKRSYESIDDLIDGIFAN